jgi:hypothetical protein
LRTAHFQLHLYNLHFFNTLLFLTTASLELLEVLSPPCFLKTLYVHITIAPSPCCIPPLLTSGPCPFSFWVAAQGALVVYCVIIWYYAHYMNKLDIEYGVAEGEES